jgi:predicted phage-related endonuclease
MTKTPTVAPLLRDDEAQAIARTGRLPRTPGVPVVPHDATDETWLAARRRGVGASEMAAVMGESPYSSPFALWWTKQEGWPPPPPELRHRVGHAMEEFIAATWWEDHPEFAVYRPGARLWASAEHDFILATPDYLVVNDNAPDVAEPLECKSDDGGKGWTKDDIPWHHKLQVWQQCFVMGATRGHLQRTTKKAATSYVIPFDDEAKSIYAECVEAARSFVVSLQTGIAPEIDGHPSTEDALKELNPLMDEDSKAIIPELLLQRYEHTAVALKMEKARYDLFTNQLRDAMGRAQYAIDKEGVVHAERRIYKRAGYNVPSSIVDAIYRKAH